MRLKSLAGWNQVEDDWRLFLSAGPEGCFVAESEGMVVGTVTSVNYQNLLSWIAMVLVDPDHRRRGIGTSLLNAALESLSECQSVKLDATAAGRKLYESLGFVEECGVTRMVAEEPGAAGAFPPEVRPLGEGDLGAAAGLDCRALGADRGAVLRALRDRTPELAWALARGGCLEAFCLGRRGSRLHQVGPVVAQSAEDAVGVAVAALSRMAGRPTVIDVPEVQGEFRQWLGQLGFRQQRAFVRMRLGPNTSPGMPAMQFAIAGPELG
jgi:hypothetical protein